MSGYVLLYGFEQKKNEFAVPAESPLVVQLNVSPNSFETEYKETD
jgi:hypothetical protein